MLDLLSILLFTTLLTRRCTAAALEKNEGCSSPCDLGSICCGNICCPKVSSCSNGVCQDQHAALSSIKSLSSPNASVPAADASSGAVPSNSVTILPFTTGLATSASVTSLDDTNESSKSGSRLIPSAPSTASPSSRLPTSGALSLGTQSGQETPSSSAQSRLPFTASNGTLPRISSLIGSHGLATPIASLRSSSTNLDNSSGPTKLSHSGAVSASTPEKSSESTSKPAEPLVTSKPKNHHDTTHPPAITQEPSTISTSEAGFLVPITTSFGNDPKPTNGATKIPCHVWFFNLCPKWDDLNIFGWEVHFPKPPGVHPPGPPPKITIGPPPGGLDIQISGELQWPKYTVGPDHIPTFPPQPPDGKCVTKSAQLCATRTSFGVSVSKTATITTTSKVLSTCSTVFGCDVQDQGVTATTTGTTSCTSITTVTNVWVSCPTSASIKCSTTSTSLVSGCSVTPTTKTCGGLTPTGFAAACSPEKSVHYVYPRDGSNKAQVNSIQSELRKYVSKDSDIKTSQTKLSGVLYWTLPLTSANATEVKKMSQVEIVYLEHCTIESCYDATTAIVFQEDAPDQLTALSWPERLGTLEDPAIKFKDLQSHYNFDDSAGEGINVYIADSGATLDHPEFVGIKDRVRWIQVNPEANRGMTAGGDLEDDAMTDPAGHWYGKAHGTSMLALVAGRTFGPAKNINPILVRLPRRGPTGQSNAHDFLTAIETVRDDVGDRKENDPIVILLMSLYFSREHLQTNLGDYGPWLTRVHQCLEQLAGKGVLLVTGAGNFASSWGIDATNSVDGWPANFGKMNNRDRIQSLIVAGTISADGTSIGDRYDTTGGLPHVWAPGLHVRSAEGNRNRWATLGHEKDTGGTSDAAALTAGLAANLAKLASLGQLRSSNGGPVPQSPDGIRQHILDLSWSRQDVKGGPRKAIFNGVQPPVIRCRWDPDAVYSDRRRNDGPLCKQPLSSSSKKTQSPLGSVTSQSSTKETPHSSRPSPPPGVPLAMKPVVCHNEADFKGHADINPNAQSELAFPLCVEGAKDLGPGQHKKAHNLDQHNISYDYSISWLDGCITTVDRQSVQYPIGQIGPYCQKIFTQAMSSCNNGGVGGYIDMGCLRYEFTGGR